MGSTAGIGYIDTLDKLLGKMLTEGNEETPFLSVMGAGNSGSLGGIVPCKVDTKKQFAMSQTQETDTPSQDTVSEVATTSAGTARYYERDQNLNSIEFIRRSINLSDFSVSTQESITGLSIADKEELIRNEMTNQAIAHTIQIRKNLNFSCLGGTEVIATTSAIAGQTGGVLKGITTHLNDLAGAAVLSKAMIDSMIDDLWQDGTNLVGSIFVCDMATAQKIRDLYEVSPRSRNVGGVDLDEVIFQGGYKIGILLDQAIVHIQNADANKKYLGIIQPNLCQVRGVLDSKANSAVYMKRPSEEGFSEKRDLLAQVGMDYGSERKHGLIYDFTLA